MEEMRFSISINASRETVWATLWQDDTFRQWAGIIDPGTYMVGELAEGSKLQFISANGYGVTSLVEKLMPNELLLLRHQADTQESGKRKRAKEWTGGKESYKLAEKYGATVLTITCDVPHELEGYFQAAYPKALERIKLLAEHKK
ncbi:MAG TPA: SRPBCC domain-containing protein [Candidatus Saccharimonadales bacterium]|nr:SRPBCC domain-containing protein [Candidatus Saccharimonadales bacterium]